MSAVETVLAGLDAATAWQEELYVHLHAHPELSMMEVETAAEISRRLASYGYAVQRIGGGVVGVLANGAGPTVLFRADIDALPLQEDTGLPYASTVTQVDRQGVTQPVMHACGHDLHTTAGLGAAALLAGAREAWSGTYIALFQPGEETIEGALAMVADGLVDKVPRPDVALAQHVMGDAAGTVGTVAGPILSTAGGVDVTVFGKGSHGSMPHLGVDPVLLGATIVTRLQGIVAREIAPDQFGVVTVGAFHAGTKANIIPDRATLMINVRAYDEAVRDQLLAAIERIVRAECAASGSPTEPTFQHYERAPLTSNDPEATDVVRQAFLARFGPERARVITPITASEDFSTIPRAWGIPYCFWTFGGFTPESPPVANHNPRFAPAIQPTLRTATEAAVVGVLAHLARR